MHHGDIGKPPPLFFFFFQSEAQFELPHFPFLFFSRIEFCAEQSNNSSANTLTETSILYTDGHIDTWTDTRTYGQTGWFQYIPENIRFAGGGGGIISNVSIKIGLHR